MKNKLVIGTANFGMAYGQGVNPKELSVSTIKNILQSANHHGISILDTAISYGDAYKKLGSLGLESWSVITKIPKITNEIDKVDNWVTNSITKSLEVMRIPSFEAILIHNPKDVTGVNGKELISSLKRIKGKGLTRKIGLSIYEKIDLEQALDVFQPDIIQCPFNILDNRMLQNNYLSKLSRLGIEIHVRSIFLQGLLIRNSESIPDDFKKFKSFWAYWHLWLKSNKLEPVEACVRYVNSISEIDKIIVGVNSTLHLKEILNYYTKPPIYQVPSWNSVLKKELVDPRLWKKNKT